LPDTFVSLVVDGGSELTPALVAQLRGAGWPVVLMRIPDTVCTYADTTLPSDLTIITSDSGDEAAIDTALSDLRDSHGQVGALVYLHHHITGDPAAGSALASSVAEAIRRPFILAKSLWSDLAAAAGAGWAGFFTVTRLDGALGTTGQLLGGAHDLAAGGLAGLTKTLQLEWPTVACRTVDVAPALAPDQAAQLILGEIRDPNRLIAEVGWGSHGRITLEANLAPPASVVEGSGYGA
jgi:hypothetical protein